MRKYGLEKLPYSKESEKYKQVFMNCCAVENMKIIVKQDRGILSVFKLVDYSFHEMDKLGGCVREIGVNVNSPCSC